jgi:nucleotide-binding universal stress UspA family protein
LRGRKVGKSIAADTFHRILVVDDGTPEGERAAELGVRFAARVEAEVVLLGIVEPPNIQATGEGLPLEDPTIRHRQIEKRFYDYLHLGRSLGLEITAEIVEGWASTQIRRRAKTARIDLVIVGHRRLNWFQRWLIRSSAGGGVRGTGCSVMSAR